MLDYRLDTFISLCETRNFTKTAEQLHISQPSVSQHIKYIEDYYCCNLFYYIGRRLELTEEGKYLYEKASVMIANSKKISEDILNIKKQKTLVIGMTSSVRDSFVADKLCEYIDRCGYSNIKFNISTMQSLCDDLRNGKIDMAFSEGIFLKQELITNLIYHIECVYLMAGKDVYDEYKTNPDFSIKDKTLLLPCKGSGLRTIAVNYLNSMGISLKSFHNIIDIEDTSLIKTLVHRKDYIAFLFSSNVKEEIKNEDLFVICEKKILFQSPFYFLYLKNSLSEDFYQNFFEEFKKCK